MSERPMNEMIEPKISDEARNASKRMREAMLANGLSWSEDIAAKYVQRALDAPVASGQDADWEIVRGFLRSALEHPWGNKDAAISAFGRLRNAAPVPHGLTPQDIQAIDEFKDAVTENVIKPLVEKENAELFRRDIPESIRKSLNPGGCDCRYCKPVPHNAVVPTDAELHALIKIEWKKIKPSLEAQQIRSGICVSFDGPYPEWAAHYMPEYVSDLLDIAAQKGINETASSVVPNVADGFPEEIRVSIATTHFGMSKGKPLESEHIFLGKIPGTPYRTYFLKPLETASAVRERALESACKVLCPWCAADRLAEQPHGEDGGWWHSVARGGDTGSFEPCAANKVHALKVKP